MPYRSDGVINFDLLSDFELIRNACRIWQKVGNGVSYYTRFPLCTMLCAGYSVKLLYVWQKKPSILVPYVPSNCRGLSGESQPRALPRCQRKKMEILNISFLRLGIELTTCSVYSGTLVWLSSEYHEPNSISYPSVENQSTASNFNFQPKTLDEFR